MIYELIHTLLRKHFYLVYFEKFTSDNSNAVVERIMAKHPLLKPQLIVINDNIHGFKALTEEATSLEKFPIYIEVEYAIEDGETYIDQLDIYSEVKIKSKNKLSDVLYLANIYSKSIYVEQVKRFNDPTQESLLIYSKLNDIFQNEAPDVDEDNYSELLNEFEVLLEVHLVSFVNFIKILDDVLVKGKRLNRIDQIFQSPNQ